MANNQSQGSSGSKWLYTLGAIVVLVLVLGTVNVLFNRPNNQQTAYNQIQAYGAGLGQIKLVQYGIDSKLDLNQAGPGTGIHWFQLQAPQKENIKLSHIVFSSSGTLSPGVIKQVCLLGPNSSNLACTYGSEINGVSLGAGGLKIPAGGSQGFMLTADFWADHPSVQNGRTQTLSVWIDPENVYAYDKDRRRVKVSLYNSSNYVSNWDIFSNAGVPQGGR